ncbi:MAG TPA: M56 family metallopeptidase, partial [Bryobacteraceae bacterium]|nr:M56 family metallopeptidase [Bryobacteraceae bacterium]
VDVRPVRPVRPVRAISWPIAIWLAGVATMLARIVVGHVRLALSLRRAREVRAPEWIAARDAAGQRIGLRRIVKLRRSSETDVPLTGGVFAASVVLPETSEDWDAERRSIVLLHELTHARRRDPLLWLMARVAVALYWFHPLAWLAAARFRREQERSCDDAVVRAGTEQAAYAEQLVGLARSVAHAGAYAAALGMAATSDLEQRVRALLDTRSNRGGLSRRVCWTAVAALLAVVVPLAALHGQASQPDASLSGAVYDASGAVVPGVLILLKNNTDHQEAARANAAGEYSFSVPAGSYTMEVRARGFAELQKAIVLPAARMNIILEIGQVTEAVDVVGKAPRPQETGTPHRIRVGGMVQGTKLVTMTKPVYPPGAEAAGIEGTVLLRAVISTGGDLLGLSVINQSVDGGLAAAAMDAVKQWHYNPTLLNGEPVEVATTIAVTFRLER